MVEWNGIFRLFRFSGAAFHSTKNTEISGPKLNGTVKIPGKVFENLGIRFECNLFPAKTLNGSANPLLCKFSAIAQERIRRTIQRCL